MSTLITGASGLIGRHLVESLRAREDVWAVSRRDRPLIDGITWITADLAASRLPPAMPRGVDTVIHLAQSDHFRDFPARALDVFDVNVGSTARLLDWSRQHGVKRFVYASSGGVEIGGGYYLASKRCAELLAEHYAPFFHVVVVRLFFVYGRDQRPSMLIPRLVEAVRTGQAVRLDGPDGMRLNPIHVSDAVMAVEGAARLEASARFDVAGPDVLTLRRVAEIIGQQLDRTPTFVRGDETQSRDFIGEITAMTTLVGAPRVPFAAGVEDLCRAEHLG
jgi:UDP-glucose 4-epimerase